MHVLVLVSGVADPKWPLPRQSDAAALAAHAARYALPSPFDEAALELALQLRDADPATTITAAVAGPEALARKVAEWRLDAVHRLAATAPNAWDAGASAQALATACAGLARAASVVLCGREFGDWDDGSVPALLARNWKLAHVPLTLGVDVHAGRLRVTRQRGAALERWTVPAPALLSVTNDARNKLRHPLLKNVMAARRLQILTLAIEPGAPAVACTRLAPAVAPPRAAACRMLAGSLDEQARELADLLRQEGVPA